MSFTDKLVLWLHIAFVIFAIGPLTVAIMSTPRYIRKRNVVVVRYQYRTTMIFSVAALGVLIFGAVLAQLKHEFNKPWLIVSLTLFIVSLALLLLILRDQHRAIAALEDAQADAEEAAVAAQAAGTAEQAGPAAGAAGDSAGAAQLPGDPPAAGVHLAHVERGRIVSLGGVVSVLWLVILVLMVWNG